MSRFAEKTSVSSEKSRAEVERTLTRYGADSFMYGWEGINAMVGFRMHERMIRFVIPLPAKDAEEYRYTPAKKYKRTEDERYKAWEQAVRQRWRALALVVKAKLEAVDSGITTFEEEFMAHILLPDGRTVSDFMVPQIQAAYDKGDMPKMLPLLGPGA